MTILAVCGPIGCDLKGFSEACYQQLNNDKAKLIDSTAFVSQESLVTYLQQTQEDVIVFGSDLFLEASLRQCFDIKLFLELDSDLCLSYLVQSNLERTDFILEHYLSVVKPSNERIRHSSQWADLLLPQFGAMDKVIRLLIDVQKKTINKVLLGEEQASDEFSCLIGLNH